MKISGSAHVCHILQFTFFHLHYHTKFNFKVIFLTNELHQQCCFRTGLTQTKLYTHRRWLAGFKFQIEEEKGLYCLCIENKGADQLRSYCEADLHL